MSPTKSLESNFLIGLSCNLKAKNVTAYHIIVPVDTLCGVPRSVDVVNQTELTEPLGIFWIVRPASVIVNGADAAIEPVVIVSVIVFERESGAVADITTAPLITTGATSLKKPVG